MNKQEWGNKTNRDIEEISENEWQVVSLVYTFHPAISEVNGKEEMAGLWKLGGVALIKEMEPIASTACDLETKVNRAKVALRDAEDDYQKLRSEYGK